MVIGISCVDVEFMGGDDDADWSMSMVTSMVAIVGENEERKVCFIEEREIICKND